MVYLLVLSTVRERVERLEALMSERSNIDLSHDPMSAESPMLPHPVASAGGGTSSSGTTPLRKIKLKNCEYVKMCVSE